jgi:hypothetical protein
MTDIELIAFLNRTKSIIDDLEADLRIHKKRILKEKLSAIKEIKENIKNFESLLKINEILNPPSPPA